MTQKGSSISTVNTPSSVLALTFFSSLDSYLFFLLSALNDLPKVSVGEFYRGVSKDAVKVRLTQTKHAVICFPYSNMQPEC